MSDQVPATGLQLRSTIRKEGTLRLELAEVPIPAPGEGDVVVRVEAAPINPSDMGLLFGPADMTTARAVGSDDSPAIEADVPAGLLPMARTRFDTSMPVGNEGGGVVVAAGASPAAQALLGKTVGIIGGAAYSQYRTLPAAMCLPLHDGTTSREAAACFVNPLTALGMVETMRSEGHTALVHTAAASNLGQMLVKICAADGVPLVNIVRRDEQAQLLQGLGAKFVCNSSSESFESDLTDALAETGATIAFDATGGGRLASDILRCMEAALTRSATEFVGYGSETHKQVYLYGSLDRSPTTLVRAYGMAWSVGGWLLTPFLRNAGPETGQKLRQRVADEIKTTFASHYTQEVSLKEALTVDAIRVYGKQATGEKYLITPHAG